MKKMTQCFALVLLSASLFGCASNMTTKQKNTAIGAAVGGVAGNMIGGDTGSTLGGAALGGVIGSQVR
jgi:osmotically inducible lipoprotein OsmB